MRPIQKLAILTTAFLMAGCAGSQGGSIVPPAGVANSVRPVSNAYSGPWTQPIIVVNHWQTMLTQQSEISGCWTSSRPQVGNIQPGKRSRPFTLRHDTQCTNGPLNLLWGASIYFPYACFLVVTPTPTGFKYGVKNEPAAACRVHEINGKVYLEYRLRKEA